MDAGRELDALVAEKVFGLQRVSGAAVPQKHYPVDSQFQEAWVDAEGQRVFCKHCGDMPAYSTEIAAAWQVYLKAMEGLFSQRMRFYEGLEAIAEEKAGFPVAWPDVFTVLREDMPLAFCLAAVAAKGGLTP